MIYSKNNFCSLTRSREESSYGVELHLLLLPKNVQNTFDADNDIIRSTYKMETFQGITAHGT